MNRRTFLKLLGIVAVTSSAVLYWTVDYYRVISSMLSLHLADWKIDKSVIERFLEDEKKHNPLTAKELFKYSIYLKFGFDISNRISDAFEETSSKVAQRFVLSTNLPSDPATIQYVAYYDPYVTPCFQPFARTRAHRRT